MQDDGNLVLYGSHHQGQILWASNSAQAGAAVHTPWGQMMPVQAQPVFQHRNKLLVNEVLKREEKLTSQNGQYDVIVKTEGRIVIHGPGGKEIWRTEIPKFGIIHNHTYLVLQNDGNLVLYNPFFDKISPEKPIWASDTCGKDKNPTLVIQDDGNLVLFGS